MSLVISTATAAKNFLLMQKCLALYVVASILKSDAFNLKSCGMNATGNATMAYPKCYDAAPHRSLDLTITFTPLVFSMEALCSSNFMARRFLNCAKVAASQGLQEVERGSLLAERREAIESESRTWSSWESILSLTTLVANFWAQRVLQEPVFTPLLTLPQV
ncbi:hypothetical protein ARMGADRAFT_1087761 [Armillaria gallica]|uniref:Uncharacterized protein n=1 Tax=Armillaria gallica TaxID=47427 RepID=A0A2H3D104_ARMGA|nr:hypothetical protein ARMGADRAFT_1087761 [Armillaria gallica]